MTILSSLVRAYERLPNPPPFGYSVEKIGFIISLNSDGSVANVTDMRTGEGRKREARLMEVPQPPKRTSGVSPSFLWDKTSYVLGVTAGEGRRLALEHASFRDFHLRALADVEDEGLAALRRFIERWSPEAFNEDPWTEELKDQNVAFAFEIERLQNTLLHDRIAAKEVWARLAETEGAPDVVCLIRGERGPIARLHPSVKGVWGAQSSGASLVAFNAEAYESYGHEQGDNAQISKQAAFAYATALNHFLAKGSRNRIQIGDASTVFWADASDADVARECDDLFRRYFTDVDEAQQSDRVRDLLEGLRTGRPLDDLDPKLARGVRFFVLGLAPNAARIAIRFWFDSDFGDLARNYQRYVEDMRIEPPPRQRFPPLWQYLVETAVQRKSENIVPKLAGEWMRAILTGGRYPLTLLNTVLMRIRADKEVNALRVGILKALLIRNFERKDTPVALDLACTDKGYLLGRLFALYEQIQSAALGRNVNATIKDKFYGAASAQPRKVFPMIDRNSANHLAKLAKQKPRYKVDLDRTLSEIMERMAPAEDPFPASLSSEQQALFSLGYYHQRSEFFRSRKVSEIETETAQ